MPRIRTPEDPRPTLIYFASRRSGPCRRVQAFLDQVLQSRRNHETFRRSDVDVDEQPELARRFQVEQLPTIIVVHEGKIAQRIEGRVGTPQIRTVLAVDAEDSHAIAAFEDQRLGGHRGEPSRSGVRMVDVIPAAPTTQTQGIRLAGCGGLPGNELA